MTRNCPECGIFNEDNEWRCGACGTVLRDERITVKTPDNNICCSPFTIERFLKENSHLFTIIGVIGTMIILLPSLGERILGQGWLQSDLFVLPMLFAILTIGGGTFIFAIFIILLKDLWSNRKNEKIMFENSIFSSIKMMKGGDLQRIILSIILLFMMFGALYFIFAIVVLIPNYQTLLMTIYIILAAVIIFIIYQYVNIIKNGFTAIKEFFDRGYDIYNFIGFAAFYIILFGFIAFLIFIPLNNLQKVQQPHDIFLLTDQEVYSPLVSTTIGLELYPTNSTNIKNYYPIYEISGFRWETNYGYFVTQDQYSSKVYLLDNYTVRRSQNKVYWSYSKSDIPENKTLPIEIKLKVYHAEGANWTYLTNSSLTLTWTEQEFARVQDFTNHSIGICKISSC